MLQCESVEKREARPGLPGLASLVLATSLSRHIPTWLPEWFLPTHPSLLSVTLPPHREWRTPQTPKICWDIRPERLGARLTLGGRPLPYEPQV